MKYLLKIFKRFSVYLWSGWSSISLFCYFLPYGILEQFYGNLVLPSPKETIQNFILYDNEPKSN